MFTEGAHACTVHLLETRIAGHTEVVFVIGLAVVGLTEAPHQSKPFDAARAFEALELGAVEGQAQIGLVVVSVLALQAFVILLDEAVDDLAFLLVGGQLIAEAAALALGDADIVGGPVAVFGHAVSVVGLVQVRAAGTVEALGLELGAELVDALVPNQVEVGVALVAGDEVVRLHRVLGAGVGNALTCDSVVF